jgi:transposase
MPPVDRNKPIRAASSDSQYSLMEFIREFPDDASCLEHLWRSRYSPDGEHAECPKCERERVFKRYKTKQGRQSWTCTGCGHHVHPTANTIFHKSSTSLHLWYYGMYLMASTKCGISAKHLGRELGVNYRTAWRMFNRIRNELMKQDETPLSGDVEVDETAWGGKPRASDSRERGDARRWRHKEKAIVFGMVERGGRVRATIVPDSSAKTLGGVMHSYILPSSMIFTDEYPVYLNAKLDKRYIGHRRIRHADRVYVSGDVHTQTIEGFFGNLKRGISGNYHSVSKKWLQGYLNEYCWRYNHRDDERAMFGTLLVRAAATRV